MQFRSSCRFKIAGLTLASLAASAGAVEIHAGEGFTLRANGVVTLGTALRTEAADPALLGALATTRVGAPAGALAGNAGGSDLNFAKNEPVSTVLKALLDLEAKQGAGGIFVRIKAWDDQELRRGRRAYGNIPNGFAMNAPLSDAGFDPHARFSNALIEDANAFGRIAVGTDSSLDLRLGRQVVSWGLAQFTGGGLNIVNPVDAAAAVRPGATSEEGRLPVGMAYGKLNIGKRSSVELWSQYEFRHNVLNGCGTFFAVTNYAPTGCNYVSVLGAAGVNDPTALSTGRFPKRADDVEASNGGQWGLSLAHRLQDLGTELRAYAANYHSRTPSIRVTNPNVNGGYGLLGANPTRLTDANGLKYAMLFVENIHLYGLSVNQPLQGGMRFYGELAYRPDQPLALNASDLIAAFLQRSPTSALNLARGSNALPPGARFDGYDRYKVGTLTLGFSKAFAGALGAERVSVAGELGYQKVGSLPDAGRLRYGRSDDYGTAAVTGGAACVDNTAAGKTCALDGFVSRSAWGYRLRVAATYPGLVFGGTLSASLLFSGDVSGYSYDGSLSEGRKTLRPALRVDWGSRYFAEAVYTRLQGGRYFNQTDRDTLALSGGFKF